MPANSLLSKMWKSVLCLQSDSCDLVTPPPPCGADSPKNSLKKIAVMAQSHFDKPKYIHLDTRLGHGSFPAGQYGCFSHFYLY